MKTNLEKIRLLVSKKSTEQLEYNSKNSFLGQDLSNLNINVPQEHLTCQCYRSFRNNLKCKDHNVVFEYLNRSEMLLIDELDQQIQSNLINTKIKSLRK